MTRWNCETDTFQDRFTERKEIHCIILDMKQKSTIFEYWVYESQGTETLQRNPVVSSRHQALLLPGRS